MKDVDYRKQRQRIRKCFEKWRIWLGLEHWQISLHYSDEGLTAGADADGWKTTARCSVQWQYMKARIDWDVPAIADIEKDSDLDEIVVHELCHILVNEMREEGIKHEERVVTSIENAIMWSTNATAAETEKRLRRKKRKAKRAKPK